MTVRIERRYICNHCGKEGSTISSEHLLPDWFQIGLTPSVLRGTAFNNQPLRAANAISSNGDYCSLQCVHTAIRKAGEDILKAIRDEINEINSQNSEQTHHNIGEGS